ncbi:unnamed protein product [Euphydryas editha]|uniref:Uncharacterized protein n=1 Tax=Euphydryas editha TaxID=104508 RepID=A0AAU9UYD6_EUPED|nr:unnamed protein product [Euphydryas editha]
MCECGCEAGDIVRLVARWRVGGDGEGRRHHVVPASAGRHARRLGPLLLRALQRRARLRARARAERRAAGGDADGLGGPVEQLALRDRTAGGVRAARAAAARAARQLMRTRRSLARTDSASAQCRRLVK